MSESHPLEQPYQGHFCIPPSISAPAHRTCWFRQPSETSYRRIVFLPSWSTARWHWNLSYHRVTFVIWFLDGSEPFLTCGVPKHSLDSYFPNLILLDLEVDPNGTQILSSEGILSFPQQESSFTNPRIPNKDKLQSHLMLLDQLGHKLIMISQNSNNHFRWPLPPILTVYFPPQK